MGGVATSWHWILLFSIAVIYLTGWLLIPKALLIARTPQAAIGWSLALLFLPPAAIPLFLVFGESRFSGYLLAGHGDSGALDDLRRRVREPMRPAAADFDEKYRDTQTLIERLRGLPASGGNEVRLLIDGAQAFDAMFRAIDQARHCVLVQFFIIRADAVGNELKNRLATAAARGVKVYVLFDSVGSKDLPLDYLAALRRAGIRAHGFVTNRQLGMRFQINFRNHRKLVLVDGDRAFIGGLNAADEYQTGGGKFPAWRDTHLELRGPAASAMLVNFAEDWLYATDEPLRLDPPSLAAAPSSTAAASPAAGATRRVAVFASGPADPCSICEMVFTAAISAARRRLWLASPYFVPDLTLKQLLMQAALRGVEVRILLPERPDHLLAWLSSFSYYPSLRDAGVRVYRYRPGFMHQKVLLVDDDFAMVGSVNADYRSFLLNFELSAAVNDPAFAAEVAAMLERDFANSRAENMNLFDEAGLWFRLRVKLANLLGTEQ